MNTYQGPDRRERKVSMEETGYNVHTATVHQLQFCLGLQSQCLWHDSAKISKSVNSYKVLKVF